jgi:Flp pilus assembly protein TadD
MNKARSGQQLTADEQQQLRDAFMKRAPAPAPTAAAPSFAPPEIQAIMDKARSGQPPTAEEKAQLEAWAKGSAKQDALRYADQKKSALNALSPETRALLDKKKGGQPLSPDEEQQLRQGMLQSAATQGNGTASQALRFMQAAENATPKENPAAHLETRAPLDQAAYLKLLATILDETRAATEPEAFSKLSAFVAKAPKKAGVTGAMLAFTGNDMGPAAWAIATQARSQPKDALLASNLGVVLYNANFFERSWDVLTYAEKLHPGSGVLRSNRAFTALYAGDFTTAERLFNEAARLAPRLADPQVGLALLWKARGNHSMMMTAAAQAQAQGSASPAVQAMTGQSHATETSEERANDTPLAELAGNLGGIVIDVNGGAGMTYPVWTIPTDLKTALTYVPDYLAWVAQEGKYLDALGKRRKAADEALVTAIAQRNAALKADGYFIRRNPYLLTVLTDLGDIYGARAGRVLHRLEDSLKNVPAQVGGELQTLNDKLQADVRACGQNNDPCVQHAAWAHCTRSEAAGKRFHASISAALGSAQADLRDVVTTYFRESRPYVEGIADPQLQETRQLDREFLLHTFLLASREHVAVLGSLQGFAVGPCPPPPPPEPAQQNAIKKDPDVDQPSPGQCHPQPGSKGLGPVNVSWNCNGFRVEGGEGLFGGVEVKFPGSDRKGTLSGHTETTVFAGVGDQLAIGDASGKMAATISFTQSQGQVVDVGAKVETSASAEGYGSKLEGSTELSVGLRNGVNYSGSGQASWRGTTLASDSF